MIGLAPAAAEKYPANRHSPPIRTSIEQARDVLWLLETSAKKPNSIRCDIHKGEAPGYLRVLVEIPQYFHISSDNRQTQKFPRHMVVHTD